MTKIKLFILVIVYVLSLIFYKTVIAEPHWNGHMGVWYSYHDPLFQKIGYCESRHNLTAKNKNSSASGAYQFINSTWKHYAQEYWGDDWQDKDVFSLDNRELAWYVYQKYGTGDWNASKHCWQ